MRLLYKGPGTGTNCVRMGLTKTVETYRTPEHAKPFLSTSRALSLPVFGPRHQKSSWPRSKQVGGSGCGTLLANIGSSTSPSSALLPVFGVGFPYSRRLQKKGYPYSNLSTGGPSQRQKKLLSGDMTGLWPSVVSAPDGQQ